MAGWQVGEWQRQQHNNCNEIGINTQTVFFSREANESRLINLAESLVVPFLWLSFTASWKKHNSAVLKAFASCGIARTTEFSRYNDIHKSICHT